VLLALCLIASRHSAAQLVITPDTLRLGSLGPPAITLTLDMVWPVSDRVDSLRVEFPGAALGSGETAFASDDGASGCGAYASAGHRWLAYRFALAPAEQSDAAGGNAAARAVQAGERCRLGIYATRFVSETSNVLVAHTTIFLASGTTLVYDGPLGSERPATRVVVARPARTLGITVLAASFLAAGLAMLLWLARAGNRRDRL
jgi:hypothetical protein